MTRLNQKDEEKEKIKYLLNTVGHPLDGLEFPVSESNGECDAYLNCENKKVAIEVTGYSKCPKTRARVAEATGFKRFLEEKINYKRSGPPKSVFLYYRGRSIPKKQNYKRLADLILELIEFSNGFPDEEIKFWERSQFHPKSLKKSNQELLKSFGALPLNEELSGIFHEIKVYVGAGTVHDDTTIEWVSRLSKDYIEKIAKKKAEKNFQNADEKWLVIYEQHKTGASFAQEIESDLKEHNIDIKPYDKLFVINADGKVWEFT